MASRVPVLPPVSPGVAARFPEPAVSFPTPAFAAGRSDFTRSDEVRNWLARLAADPAAGGPEPGRTPSGGSERSERGGVNAVAGRRGATEVRMIEIGTSQGGEPIVAIAFTRPFTAASAAPQARAPAPTPAPAPPAAGDAAPGVLPAPAAPLPQRRPSVLFVAGQHGDEPAGTEALLVLAEQLAFGQRDRVLDRIDVVLVPLANPDARGLFQSHTADGTDLDRDHVLLRSPEAQAIAGLAEQLEPLVVADFQEYAVGAFQSRFNALPRFDVLVQAATVANLPSFVTRAAEEWLRRPLVASLAQAGFATEWSHAVVDSQAPDRRVAMASVAATNLRNAFGLRNAVALVVETRGGGIGRADLKRRVQASLTAAASILDSAAARSADLQRLRLFVDRDVAGRACRGEAVLDAAPTPSEYALAMLDADTGAIRRVTVNWDSALELRSLRSRPRPCGYWLGAAHSDAVARLRKLGIEVQQLAEAAELRGESYREIAREGGRAPASAPVGTGEAGLRVQTQPALIDVPAGSYYISLEQPLANLAIAALEPESPASFAAHRLVGNVGEQARVLARPNAKMTPAP